MPLTYRHTINVYHGREKLEIMFTSEASFIFHLQSEGKNMKNLVKNIKIRICHTYCLTTCYIFEFEKFLLNTTFLLNALLNPQIKPNFNF